MTEFKFALTAQEINVIAAGLQELPYKAAQPLLMKLQQQLDDQQPKEPKAPEERSGAAEE